MPQTDIETLENLPIRYNENMAHQITVLVDSISIQADTSTAESQIDRIVYDLYELTPDEIHMIESSQDKRR